MNLGEMDLKHWTPMGAGRFNCGPGRAGTGVECERLFRERELGFGRFRRMRRGERRAQHQGER
jgi:hypothetical protein